MSLIYKVGDKVYLLDKTPEGEEYIPRMEPCLGKMVTISRIGTNYYDFKEDEAGVCWYDYDIDHEKTNKLRYMFSKGV